MGSFRRCGEVAKVAIMLLDPESGSSTHTSLPIPKSWELFVLRQGVKLKNISLDLSQEVSVSETWYNASALSFQGFTYLTASVV
jgi:hypothetical protein